MNYAWPRAAAKPFGRGKGRRWFIISAFVDGLFGLHAWVKMHDEFRFMLTEVPPKPSDYNEDFALMKWSQSEER